MGNSNSELHDVWQVDIEAPNSWRTAFEVHPIKWVGDGDSGATGSRHVEWATESVPPVRTRNPLRVLPARRERFERIKSLLHPQTEQQLMHAAAACQRWCNTRNGQETVAAAQNATRSQHLQELVQRAAESAQL